MTIIQAIILGVVEGISEFLPISSTAHLIITAKLLQIEQSSFLSSFLISIQLGAILSVAVLYAKTIWQKPKLILKISAAFIPTAIIGLTLYQFIKSYLLDNLLTISLALLFGGIAIIFLEKYFKQRKEKDLNIAEKDISKDSEDTNESSGIEKETALADITYSKAVYIGLFQALAVVPGVSRSAATIMGGLSLGISRQNIVEFSFLLALPTMAAATALDLYKSPPILDQSTLIVWLIGIIVSFITAILGIRFFLKYIKNNDFQFFGWYRIVIGLIILAIIIIWTPIEQYLFLRFN